MSELSEAQEKELRDAFRMFDKDNSGTISSSELGKLFAKLNYHLTDDQLQGVLARMDQNSDGAVEYKEFAKVMAAQLTKKFTREEVQKVFEYFDKDQSGSISRDELEQVFKALGKTCTPGEFETILSKVDNDHSGKLNIDEFERIVN